MAKRSEKPRPKKKKKKTAKAAPKKSNKKKNVGGRPTDYRPEYCQMLIDHMRKGGFFTYFGPKVGVSRQTLDTWTQKHAKFLDAKKYGTDLLLEYHMNLGYSGMTGQLKRLSKVVPVLHNGQPVYGADGKVLTEEHFERTTFGQAAWIFMMKNVHRFRDRLALTDDDGKPLIPKSEPIDLESLLKTKGNRDKIREVAELIAVNRNEDSD